MGKQVDLADSDGAPLVTKDYLAQRQAAALAGRVYNPIFGFATVDHVGGGRKYPYDPYYGEFSPRLALAWNPKFEHGILGKLLGPGRTVIRGGYSRIYGRMNGSPLVTASILGVGLMQPVQCIGASKPLQCLGTNGVDPTTAFRIGTDGMVAPLAAVGQTLQEPYYPGVGSNAAAGDTQLIDPKMRPNRSDQFTLSLQRAVGSHIFEAGYIGRIIRHERQEINLDAVPFMTTLNGQCFASAFANLYTQLSTGAAVQAQPFFEGAMGGSASAYCNKSASCTAALAANLRSSILSTQVYNLWASLNSTPSWTVGRTMLSSAPSQASSAYVFTDLAWGNYNALFVTWTVRDWHGPDHAIELYVGPGAGHRHSKPERQQLHCSQSLGHPLSGPNSFDVKFLYNLMMVYEPRYFSGRKGIFAHLLGGWSIAPLFTAQSGSPLNVAISGGPNTDCQSFGAQNCSSGKSYENAVALVPYSGGNSAHYKVAVTSGPGSTGNPAIGGSGMNLFTDPSQVYSGFRRPVLGIDTSGGGFSVLRGLPSWNPDATISKDFSVRERFGATLIFQFTNILNHFQPPDPTLSIDSPTTWLSSALNSPPLGRGSSSLACACIFSRKKEEEAAD
jgi:hypothetical protein